MTFKAHFDGKTIVPDEPVELTAGQRLVIQAEPADLTGTAAETARRLAENPIWKDRDDIQDSAEFARRLREEAQQRGLR